MTAQEMSDEDARQLAGELIGLFVPTGRWPDPLAEFCAAFTKEMAEEIDKTMLGEGRAEED